jgi:hypothetical protein
MAWIYGRKHVMSMLASADVVVSLMQLLCNRDDCCHVGHAALGALLFIAALLFQVTVLSSVRWCFYLQQLHWLFDVVDGAVMLADAVESRLLSVDGTPVCDLRDFDLAV